MIYKIIKKWTIINSLTILAIISFIIFSFIPFFSVYENLMYEINKNFLFLSFQNIHNLNNIYISNLPSTFSNNYDIKIIPQKNIIIIYDKKYSKEIFDKTTIKQKSKIKFNVKKDGIYIKISEINKINNVDIFKLKIFLFIKKRIIDYVILKYFNKK